MNTRSPLKIARWVLLVSILACLTIFALGMLHFISPLATLALGGWSGVIVGVSALGCVLIQIVQALVGRRQTKL